MYPQLLFFHSLFRWLLLAGLLYSLYRASRGYRGKLPFTKTDNAVRHWTATLSHIQLMLGMVLYFTSPVTGYFLKHSREAFRNNPDATFFGAIHITLMTVAVFVITIGSALAKRQENDTDKFRTWLVWFAVAILIIFLAVPWPFSPLATRPWWREF